MRRRHTKSLLAAQQFQNDMEISNNLPSPLSRFPFEDYFPISCALSGLVFIEQLEATRCSLFAPSAMCTFRRYLFKSKRLFKQIRGVWGIDLERLRDCFISGVAELSRVEAEAVDKPRKCFGIGNVVARFAAFIARYQVRRQLHRFVEVLSRLVKHRNISNTAALFQLK